MTPTLLFLHGVGDGNTKKPWRDGLNFGLRDVGFQKTLDDVPVVEPDYRDLVKDGPVPTRKLPDRERGNDDRSARGNYEVGRASLQRLLGRSGEPVMPPLPDPSPVMEPIMGLGDFPQAKRYVDSDRVRAAVLTRILDQLPSRASDLVIVGHSLGSVVAIDLLDQLPEHLRVRRVVTVGSPAGIRRLDGTRLLRRFPYDQVNSWLNVFSRVDIVTGARGLAWRYPAALDIAVQLPVKEHSAFEYLASRPAALGIGEALFGSLGTDLVKSDRSLDIRTNDVEAGMIAAVAYAHAVQARLVAEEPKIADRYAAALKVVQREVGSRLVELATADGRPVPRQIADLADGLTPTMPNRWSAEPDVALLLLVNSATTNLVRPFDIDVKGANYDVLETVAAQLGVGAPLGAHVRRALEDAARGLKGGGFRWEYVLVGVAGLGLLLLGPIGIAAGGAAGAAGAAALTSGLAAFGPGGMVGGLALAGALSVGGAAAVTASGLAIAQAAAVPLEVQILRHMAHSLARRRMLLPRQFGDWDALCQIESAVAAELAGHDGVSDDADVVKTLKKRRDLARRAVEWMIENDLAPDQPDELAEIEGDSAAR